MYAEIEIIDAVVNDICKWDTKVSVKLTDTCLRQLATHPLGNCLQSKYFEKVAGYSKKPPLYEIKVSGPQKKQYRLLFTTNENPYGPNKIIIVHAYVEKGKNSLKREYNKAFERITSLNL